MPAIRVLEYLDLQARSPFAAWFEGLNAAASAKVAAALYQIAAGNGVLMGSLLDLTPWEQ